MQHGFLHNIPHLNGCSRVKGQRKEIHRIFNAMQDCTVQNNDLHNSNVLMEGSSGMCDIVRFVIVGGEGGDQLLEVLSRFCESAL